MLKIMIRFEKSFTLLTATQSQLYGSLGNSSVTLPKQVQEHSGWNTLKCLIFYIRPHFQTEVIRYQVAVMFEGSYCLCLLLLSYLSAQSFANDCNQLLGGKFSIHALGFKWPRYFMNTCSNLSQLQRSVTKSPGKMFNSCGSRLFNRVNSHAQGGNHQLRTRLTTLYFTREAALDPFISRCPFIAPKAPLK